MRHFRKKLVSCLILLFLGLAAPLWSSQKILTSGDVKEVMDDLFVYHIEHKELKPEIVKRSFKFYLERFDVLKYYLSEAEISAFTQAPDAVLKDAVNRYYKGDLYYYQQMQATVEMAIYRARKNRELMRHEVKRNLASKTPSAYEHDGNMGFAKGEVDLAKRQKQHMERFVSIQEKSTPFVATAQDYDKMFDYYESRMREYESNYFVDEDNAAQKEHNVAFHTLKSLTKSLDTHTEYFSIDETRMMQSSLSKGFFGVGLVLQRDYRGITVHEITAGGPAERTGAISPGDQVIAIDNKNLNTMKQREIIELLHGGENPELVIMVKRVDVQGRETTKTVVVEREKVTLTSRLIDVNYERYQDGIIGKITLNSFYDNQGTMSSSKDIKKAIEELKMQGKIIGLILDIRENTGGYLTQAVEVAGLFITNGVVAAAKFADGKVHYLRDLDGKVYFDGPLVLLTSKLSASSSEIVAGTLQDYGKAIIVGDTNTFGKGTIQHQTLTMPNPKHYFKVTIGRYYTVSGKCTQLDGVKADIVVPSHYYYEKIGERYVSAPLGRDQIAPAYDDTLADLDPRAKDIFTRFYLPTLQKKEEIWVKMIPELKKNSSRRLAKNKEFQQFMKELETSDYNSRAPAAKDIQMEEAVFIIKDMLELSQKSSSTSKLFHR